MRSILEQLEDDHSIILLYIADELSSADRAQIDQRLLVDDAFARQFEELRAAHSGIESQLASLDASQPLPVSAASSSAKISRLIRQWHTDRLARRRTQVETPGIFARLAPAYPFIAAAALFCGFIIWWGLRDDGQLPPVATTQNLIDLLPADEAPAVSVAVAPDASASAASNPSVDPFFEILTNDSSPVVAAANETDADLNSAESAIQFIVSLRTMNEFEDLVDQ